MRTGRLTSPPGSAGVTEGRRSGFSSNERDGTFLSPVSVRSDGWRGSPTGRVTAPVGRASISPTEVVVFVTGVTGLVSRPLNTRDLRSSSSSGTPGVRVDAPVEDDEAGGIVLDERLALLSVLVALSTVAGLAGNPDRKGSSLIARRAIASSALLALKSSLPICFAFAVVTARSSAGLTRRRFASSSDRKAVRRPG